MRKCIVGMLFGLLILFPINVKGLMCSNETKIKYSDMAKNISVNYEYVEANDDITFSIKFTNIPEGFAIYDFYNNIWYYYKSSDLVVPAIKNKSYMFNVYIPNDACYLEVLYKHYVIIPSYNKYYKDELCKGIEDYKLCDKWLNINMSYDEWKNNINDYKKSLIKDEVIDNNKETKDVFDYIIDFYLEYYYYILPSIIILSFIGIYIHNKKQDLF